MPSGCSYVASSSSSSTKRMMRQHDTAAGGLLQFDESLKMAVHTYQLYCMMTTGMKNVIQCLCGRYSEENVFWSSLVPKMGNFVARSSTNVRTVG